MNAIISEIYTTKNKEGKKLSGSFMSFLSCLKLKYLFTLSNDMEGKWQERELHKLNAEYFLDKKDTPSLITDDEYTSLRSSSLLKLEGTFYSSLIKEYPLSTLILTSPILSSPYYESVLTILEENKNFIKRVIIYDKDPRLIVSFENFYECVSDIKTLPFDVLILGESLSLDGVKKISLENISNYLEG